MSTAFRLCVAARLAQRLEHALHELSATAEADGEDSAAALAKRAKRTVGTHFEELCAEILTVGLDDAAVQKLIDCADNASTASG